MFPCYLAVQPDKGRRGRVGYADEASASNFAAAYQRSHLMKGFAHFAFITLLEK